VQCAVAVQKEIKSRNDELAENRRMQFRIGINLGDVIQEKGRIYGDGVNIAARLEGLAEPGGICISKTAFDHIESKLPYGYDYLGDHTVKNISKPVGAYRVLLDPRVTVSGKSIDEKLPINRRRSLIVGASALLAVVVAVGVWHFFIRRPALEPASLEKMAFSLPDKPSIAVLPFDNMSEDTKQDFLVDAIAENIIATLSKSPHLFVIARKSTFTYKGKSVKIAQISEELGVRYVMEGSFLKSGDRIRITAQLIDALRGDHVWVEKYDRDFKDALTIIDDITLEIAKALSIELMPLGMKGAKLKVYTKNLEAWSLFIEGDYYFNQATEESYAKAKDLFERAIELDPNFSMGWARLSATHAFGIRYKWNPFKTESSYEEATKLALKAIELDDSNSWAYYALGDINLYQRKYDKAQTHYEKAATINPNDSQAIFALGRLLRFSGQPDKAVPLIKKSMRIDPNPHWNIPYNLGRAYYQSRKYEDAIVVFEEVLKLCEEGGCPPKWPHLQLSQVYAELGQIEKARSHMQKVLEHDPKFNLESRRKQNPYKNPADNDRVIEALRKAGAPEHPPSQ
jgi:TolB-like protein/Tfp pilus assembly protein PilF